MRLSFNTTTEHCKLRILSHTHELSLFLSHLKAVFELVSCSCKVPTLEARHAPGRPHGTRVQLALGGDFHCQMKPVILDETVTDAPGKIWLGEFLDGGDLGPAR